MNIPLIAKTGTHKKEKIMATNPKMKPCPKCGYGDYLSIYKYDSGWRRVECDNGNCQYLGPGEGSVREAIKSHNRYRNPVSSEMLATGAKEVQVR